MVDINKIGINELVIYYNLTYRMKAHLMALNGYSDRLSMRVGGGAFLERPRGVGARA
jgi:hypothetical protein